MFAVSESNRKNRIKTKKSSGSRVTSRSMPQQWSHSQNNPTKYPLFVQILFLLQKTSILLTFGAISTTLVMYGLTVYNQQFWNRQYQQLQQLQRQERNVIGFNEALKANIAASANKGNQNLIDLTSEKTIYIHSDVTPEAPETESSVPRKIERPQTDRPLGY